MVSRRFSIRKKVLVFLAAILAPPLLVGMMGLFHSQKVLEALETALKNEKEIVLPAIQLNASIQKATIPPNKYLATGDPKERFHFVALAARVEVGFGKITGINHTNLKKKGSLETTKGYWILIRYAAETLLAIPNPTVQLEAARLMALMDLMASHSAESLGELYTFSHSERVVQLANTDRSTQQMKQMVALTSVASLGWGIGLLIWWVRFFTRPITQLSEGAKSLRRGDLDCSIEINTGDEFEDLANEFNQMAMTLQENHKSLKHLAIHDGLTGLINHREFYSRLEEEFSRAKRHGHPLTLLMFDVDSFKKFNDTYGHPQGDRILKMLASTIEKFVRQSDLVARYGGEEFALLLPETAIQEGFDLAEQIRIKIAELGKEMVQAIPDTEKMQVTVSIGIASFPDDVMTSKDLVSMADHLLYDAKKAGRNRTCSTHHAKRLVLVKKSAQDT
jgi:diguanylate cyclase (GGDEF)-like protein